MYACVCVCVRVCVCALMGFGLLVDVYHRALVQLISRKHESQDDPIPKMREKVSLIQLLESDQPLPPHVYHIPR